MTDASVVINLLHVGRLEMMSRLPGVELKLSEEVIAEVTHVDHRAALDAALTAGTVGRCSLDALSAAELLSAFEGRLGIGELSCLALAIANDWIVACDEKRLFRREALSRIGEARLIGTKDLYLWAIRAGLLSIDEADGDLSVLRTRRYAPDFRSFRELMDNEEVV